MSQALSILGAGGVTAVGLSFTDTWAAIRAGLKGFTESGFFFEEDDYLRVAEVPLRRHSWESQGDQRLFSLAVHGLRDSLRYVDVPTHRCALMIGLPEPKRFDPGPRIVERLEMQLGVRFSFCSRVFAEGATSVVSALRLASQLLTAREVDICLVGGVDSYLNWPDLKQLYETGRLISAGVAQGLIPGEGAVFVAVTLAGSRLGWGQLLGIGTAEELHIALQRAAEAAGISEPELSLRISGLNGEYYAAVENLVAAARFYRTRREAFPCLLPAASVGEIGAASIALLIALATVSGANELVACESGFDGSSRRACIVRSGRNGPLARKPGTPTIRAITWQYIEDIATIWQRRAVACVRPDHTLNDLRQIDDRLEILIQSADSLEIQPVCPSEIPSQTADLFPWAILSLLNHPGDISDQLLACPSVLVSALHWLPWETAAKCIERLKSRDARVALEAAAAHHRVELHDLEAAFSSDDPAVLAIASSAAGEMGLSQFLPRLEELRRSQTPEVRRAAVRSTALLAPYSALSDVLSLRETSLAVVLMSPADAIQWLQQQAPRVTIEGARVLGDPTLIPWLIDKAEVPMLARLAVQAYCSITGLSLDTPGLSAAHRPEPSVAENDFDPVEDAAPWPDANFLREHWRMNSEAYSPGDRFWAGVPLNPSSIAGLLRTGNQVQRRDAAIELALRTQSPVFDVWAPARRQEQALNGSGAPSGFLSRSERQAREH